MGSRIVIEEAQHGGIPCLTVSREGAKGLPSVFFLHGFTSGKEQGLALGYELARRGFCYVSFDARMHGDRHDERLEEMRSGQGDYVYPVESGLDVYLLMHEIIVDTALDVRTLVAHLGEMGAVDVARIGLAGFSMGGFATYHIAAQNPEIRVAVPIAGIPAFAVRWRDVVVESSSYPKWAAAMEGVEAETEKRSAFMEAIDPYERMVTFAPKALMMICGDQDTDSPKQYSVDLYRELTPLYAACPERLRLAIHDGVAHELTPAMIQDTCRWFARHL